MALKVAGRTPGTRLRVLSQHMRIPVTDDVNGAFAVATTVARKRLFATIAAGILVPESGAFSVR
jgi:hypothetical protein